MKTGYAAAFWRARTATYLEGIDQVAWKKEPAFSPSHTYGGIPLNQQYFQFSNLKHGFSKLDFQDCGRKCLLLYLLINGLYMRVIKSGEKRSQDSLIKRL